MSVRAVVRRLRAGDILDVEDITDAYSVRIELPPDRKRSRFIEITWGPDQFGGPDAVRIRSGSGLLVVQPEAANTIRVREGR